MNKCRNEIGALLIIWKHVYVTLQICNSINFVYSIANSKIIRWSTCQTIIK